MASPISPSAIQAILSFNNVDSFGTFTCVGYAPSQRRRCKNAIAGHNQERARSLATNLSLQPNQSNELQRELDELAGLALCRRNHQDQTSKVSNKWHDEIVKEIEKQSYTYVRYIRPDNNSSLRTSVGLPTVRPPIERPSTARLFPTTTFAPMLPTTTSPTARLLTYIPPAAIQPPATQPTTTQPTTTLPTTTLSTTTLTTTTLTTTTLSTTTPPTPRLRTANQSTGRLLPATEAPMAPPARRLDRDGLPATPARLPTSNTGLSRSGSNESLSPPRRVQLFRAETAIEVPSVTQSPPTPISPAPRLTAASREAPTPPSISTATHEDDNECSICYQPYRDPHRTPCGHVYCRECISDWLEEHNTCPMDRRQLREADLVRVPEDCVICLEPCEDPQKTPCEHVFCRTCIIQWLAESNTCPHDRRRLRLTDLVPAV